MNKKKVAPHIDFDNSEYVSLDKSDETLTIHMKNSQKIPMQLIFFDTPKFSFFSCDVPKGLCLFEITENSPVLNEVILDIYGDLSKENSYKLYQLEDINDVPFMQIVAASVQVVKCIKNT